MQRVAAPDILWNENAEQIIRSIQGVADRGEAIELDLTRLAQATPGALARLGNSFRSLKAAGSKLTIRLPDLETSSPLDGHLIALQAAAQADSLVEGRRALKTAEVRDRLAASARRSQPTQTAEFNLRRSIDVSTRTVAAIEGLLKRWTAQFPEANARQFATRLAPLASAVAEASWNVSDHSHKAPLPPKTPVSSALMLSWVPRSRLQFPPQGFSGEPDLISEFLRLVTDEVATLQSLLGFISVTVADDGVGVPGRQALDLEIYADAAEVELASFTAALARGGSVKMRSQDCAVDRTPGFGLTNVVSAIWRAHGFVSLRSGRSAAHFDGFSHEASPDGDFLASTTGRVPLSGTILEALLPVYSAGERQHLREIEELRLL